MWAIRGDHLRVYPVVEPNTSHSKAGKRGRSHNVPKVRICIEIGNSKHTGDAIYQQDDKLYAKIDEIYEHYYNKRR